MRTYRTLALVGTFIKIIGWLTVIGTVLGACGVLVLGIAGSFALPSLLGADMPVGGQAASVVVQVISATIFVLAGLVAGASQIALAELIQLFIDLSTSSQRSVQLLERMAQAPFQAQGVPQPALLQPAGPPGPYQPPQPYNQQ